MFRALKRIFIYLGIIAEKATENDAINAAVVERGIRDSKARADKAAFANGQLASQSPLLKDQLHLIHDQLGVLRSVTTDPSAAGAME